jgi:hypothetical protein
MALMMGRLYDALIAAHVPVEQAKEAAEEAAGYETRLTTIERDLQVLKWMVGTTVTLQLLTLGGLLSLVWRLVKC